MIQFLVDSSKLATDSYLCILLNFPFNTRSQLVMHACWEHGRYFINAKT